MRPIWPLTPNWTTSLKETYEFKTEIITSRNGKEQRSALRTTPRRSFQFSSLVNGKPLRQLEETLVRHQADPFYLPHYTQAIRTKTSLPVSGSTVQVASVPIWLKVGEYVALSHRRRVELFRVHSISGLNVTFEEPSETSFPSGSKLAPVVEGRVPNKLPVSYVTDGVATVATDFDALPGVGAIDLLAHSDIPDAFFHGREVLLIRPNWAQAPQATFEKATETVDYGRGRTETFLPVDFTLRLWQANYLMKTAAETTRFLKLFMRARGRRSDFYMPTWFDDITPSHDILSGSAEMRVAGRAAYDAYAGDETFRAIMLITKSGQRIFQHITHVELVGPTTIFYFDYEWSTTVLLENIESISWMPVVRFAADNLTVEWVTDQVARITTNFLSLPDSEAEVMHGALDAATLYMLSTYGWDFTSNVMGDPMQEVVNVTYPNIASV